MNAISQLYVNHPYVMTLGTYYTLSAFIGALPAPTATSKPLYLFVFKFSNTLGGNILRALSTRVEGSPNFIPAVNAQNAKIGEPKVVVPMSPEETK